MCWNMRTKLPFFNFDFDYNNFHWGHSTRTKEGPELGKTNLVQLAKLAYFFWSPPVCIFRKADEAAKGAAKAPTTASIPAGPPGAGQVRDRDWVEACHAFVATLCHAYALLHAPVVPAVKSCNVDALVQSWCTCAGLQYLCWETWRGGEAR